MLKKSLKNYLTVKAVVCYYVQSNIVFDNSNFDFFDEEPSSQLLNQANFNLRI